MADKTAIEWTDASWTPIRARDPSTGKVGWHCEHASPGCLNCYSETFNERRLGTGLPFKPGHRGDVEHFLDEAMLLAPLRWRRPRKIFVCSMTDLFGDWVLDAWIDRVFAVMAIAPQHTFQVLTKRSARMRAYMADEATPGRIARVLIDRCLIGKDWPLYAERWPVQSVGDIDLPDDVAITWPLPNCWKGVSAEDQRRADERVPDLLATPAAVRFVSAEPLLGPIDFTDLGGPGSAKSYGHHGISAIWPGGHVRPCLDWIIVGGESGPGARPMHPDWARGIRDACAASGTAYFFKQWGAWAPTRGTAKGQATIWPNGRTDCGSANEGGGGGQDVNLVGKARAGRLLDGRTWDQMPVPHPVAALDGEREL